MGDINLDEGREKRAAEREAAGSPVTATLGGDTFTFPVELPFAVVEHMDRAMRGEVGSLSDMFRELLGPEQYEKLLSRQPTFSDMLELVRRLIEEYGFTEVGESPASES
ncbi:MAG: hypothetical protein ACRDHK_11195 [Actinomycetota bacterium]